MQENMIVRINWNTDDGAAHSKVLADPWLIVPEEKQAEKVIDKFFKYAAVPGSAIMGTLAALGQQFAGRIQEAVPVFASFAPEHATTIASRMLPLIHMLQDIAMPIGITVSLWGLIEIIMGNIDSGKGKLKWSIIGFVGMFIIPEAFYTIREAFQR